MAPAALSRIPLHANAGSLVDDQLALGLAELRAHKWESAQAKFERALSYQPRHVGANFLYAYTHLQLGKASDPRHLSTAAVGYGLALEFDPQAWWAAYHFGQLELERENYARACELFEQAITVEPEAAQAQLGLAICSYYLQDLTRADQAIQRARASMGDDRKTSRSAALISAAQGQFERSKRHLEKYRESALHPALVRRIEARIVDWRRALDAKSSAVQPQGAPQVSTAPQSIMEPSAEDRQRQLVIEATILRAANSDVQSAGLNLLEGLEALFSYSDGRTLEQLTGEEGSVTRSITRSISSSELSYSLNIFQSNNDWSEVVARPTLIAMENKKSTFFSGDLFLASITGQFDGEALTERIGVTVEVTPQFISDEEFLLEILLGNSDISTEAVSGTFQEAVSISASETNVNVRIRLGQTLLLAGLTERTDRVKVEKVPILGDIPIVQNLFRNKLVSDVAAETIILLTPRRVIEFDENAVSGSGAIRDLSTRPQYVRHRDFVPIPRSRTNSPFSQNFRRGDLAMPDWGETEQQALMWEEIVTYIQHL